MLIIKTVSLEFILFLFAVVHCKDPPVLLGTVKPEYRVKEGETVKLWCKFSGINDSVDNRTLTVWQNPDGQPIITDQYPRFKMRLGRYLKIRRVKLKDQGKYVCIAYNQFGKVKEEIQLVVRASNSSTVRHPSITKPTPTASSIPSAVSTTKRPPRRCNLRPSKIPLMDDYTPKFRNPSKNSNRFLEFVEGHQIKLKCHAKGARPLNVTWLKNSKPLSKSDRKHLKSKGWVLNFRSLTSNDAGTYTCTVRNAFCSIQRTFVVKVAEPRRDRPTTSRELKPKILENVLKNVTATVSEDVTFVCSALSKSHPEFHFLKWKSSKNVSNGSDPVEFIDFSKSKFREIREIARKQKGQRQVYTHRLIVRNVALADEAKYTCVVGNSAGYVSEHAFLTVLSQGEALQSDDPQTGGGIEVEQSSMTKAPTKSPRTQSDREILVEEIPLAALIGVPIAVLVLLIGTIVWCYFMTRKHHFRQNWKSEESGPFTQDQKKDLSTKISVPGKEERRNVSFNVYVDHPNDGAKTHMTEKQSGTHVKCASQHVKCDSTGGKCDSQRGKCAIERDPPLDGLIIHNEPPRTHSNRTNHRKCHKREELEFNESSGSDTLKTVLTC